MLDGVEVEARARLAISGSPLAALTARIATAASSIQDGSTAVRHWQASILHAVVGGWLGASSTPGTGALPLVVVVLPAPVLGAKVHAVLFCEHGRTSR